VISGLVTALLVAVAPSTAASLTPAQLAGQRVVYGFPGTSPPVALERRIAAGEAGAVLLLGGNIAGLDGARALAARLQAIPRPAGLRAPLLVMVDQEGGLVRRLPAPPARSAGEMGAAGPAAAAAAGLATGRAMRAVGANVDLAPVADVAREHRPRAGHVMAPFAALIRRHVPLVMLGTAVYPSLDPDAPAALSRPIATGQLRERLGFDGVTVTDALDTPALAPSGGPGAVAVKAAAAGSDMVLYTGLENGEAAAGALRDAIAADPKVRAAAVAAVARVLALRARLR